MSKQDWDDNISDQWWPTQRVEGGLRIPSPWSVLVAELRRFLRAAFLRRTRRDLMELTDEQLADIGVTREKAEREARRSFHLD